MHVPHSSPSENPTRARFDAPARRRASRPSERGASIVEFALVFPLLILLMMGVVDFGVNYGNKVQSTHAAREGARSGSVGKVVPPSGFAIGDTGTKCRLFGFALDAAINTGGAITALETDTSKNLACLTKYRTKINQNEVRVKVAYMDGNGLRTTDFTHATRQSNKYSIIVCVSTRVYSLTGILSAAFSGKFHHARSVIKTGSTSTYTTTAAGVAYIYPLPFSETPMTGDSWSWCTADDPTNG